MQKLRPMVCALLILGSLAGMAPVQASDRDIPPYMIYIDPETGKYTTTPPGHSSQTTSKDNSGLQQSSNIAAPRQRNVSSG